jgi:phage-related minor tail protein
MHHRTVSVEELDTQAYDIESMFDSDGTISHPQVRHAITQILTFADT